MQACGKGVGTKISAAEWPHDQAVPYMLRGAVTPTSTEIPFVSTALADFFVSLGAMSATTAALSRGLQFSFGDGAIISVPNVTSAAGGASFVGPPGSPIPVRALSASSLVLLPRKLAVICVLNREIFEHSAPNILPIVKAALLESMALQVDTLFFDATIGDDVRPAGVRYNVAGLTKSSSTDALTAMVADIGAITAGVRAVAGNNPVLVAMSPAQATRFKLRMSGGSDYGFELFSTSALADGVIVALASNALASAVGPPKIEAGIENTLVMDDAPGVISDSGAMVSANVRSTFQTDAVSLRVLWDMVWGLRSSSGVAWITGITAW
jgi:hypothetical protein